MVRGREVPSERIRALLLRGVSAVLPMLGKLRGLSGFTKAARESGCSFAAGTPIVMADGTSRAVETLHALGRAPACQIRSIRQIEINMKDNQPLKTGVKAHGTFIQKTLFVSSLLAAASIAWGDPALSPAASSVKRATAPGPGKTAGQKKSLPFIQPVDKTAVRLTVLDTGKDSPTYDFGPIPAGKIVTHVYTLRNDTKTAVVMDHVSTSCNCTGAIVLDDFHGGVPRILPGATARVRVTLDTAGFAPDAAGTLEGSRIEKDVFVYLVDQPIHPAVVLKLTGQLTQGVAFDPPFLNLGTVNEARGTTQMVKVTYDPGTYSADHTRLVCPADSRLAIVLQPDGPALPTLGTGTVQKTYRVSIPPHAAIGPLSGMLTLTGAAGTPASGPAPAAFSLPYTGAVQGHVAAEPSLIVFGMISRRDPYGKPVARAEAKQQRVRWILLVNPSLAPSAKDKARLTALAKTTSITGLTPGKTSLAFWRQARVQVDSPFFHTSLVLPQPVAKTASITTSKDRSDMDQTPPDVSSARLPTGSFSWLRVVLLPSAPIGQLISGQATIRFPDGEQILLPIQAEVQ